jgi:hypothetical protein
MGTQTLENTAAALTPVVVDLHGIKWTLYKGAGEHTIRDLDWAERLKYDRPRNIRNLIKRMAEAGKLGQVVCFTVEQTPGSAGGRPATEYYLTKAQALKVAAKSETAFADELLDQMIQVFLVATGHAPAIAPAEPRLSGGDSEDDKLIAVIETQLQLARANQRMKAELAQMAVQQTELARAQTAQAAKVDRLLAVQQAAEVEAQRPVTSQIPLLPVFNVAQHEALRVIRAHGFANGGRYQGSFNRAYDLYKSMYHEDLKVRAKNRGISPAELVTEMGIWDRLLAIAVKYLQPETERIHAERRMGGAYNA